MRSSLRMGAYRSKIGRRSRSTPGTILGMNVIVVVCNGLHLGFVGAYGNAWIETPRIDRLASEGVLFDQCFADNLTTLPTRRSWWTGRHGFHDPESGWTPLRHDETILADVLWNRGVRTALISDSPMLRQAGHGFGRGFDDVVWVRGSGYDPWIVAGDRRAGKINLASERGLRLPPADDPDRTLWIERWEQLLRNRAVLQTHQEENTGAARTVRSAIEWLERRGKSDDPFLLWVDILSPHGPWDLPEADRDRYATIEPDEFEIGDEGDLIENLAEVAPESLEEVACLIDVPAGAIGDVLDETELLRLRRTYAGAVTLADREIGKLLDAIDSMGLADDTLVVFAGDQGEPLGEHGYVRRLRPWLYEELIHIPLILRFPNGEYGGLRRQAITQPIDLYPTILSALGVRKRDDSSHGIDLLPLIRGEKTHLRDYACMGMDAEEFAIRTHHWHLIVPIETDPDDPPRPPELYRKPEDRWDQNNVIEEYVEIAEHLELTLRRFVESLQKGEGDDPPPLRMIARYGTNL